MIECKNLFYFPDINKIGGVETFYWYLVQKYQDWDIVIIYRTGDQNQINRLRKYAKVYKFGGQQIKCVKAFFNYSADIIDYVDAEEYIQILHGDYKALKVQPHVPQKVTMLIGVSQLVCDTFSEITGRKLTRVYNPIVVPKPRKVLNLISATRLTREKGRDRIIKLGNILDHHNIPYVWTIYTNDVNTISNPNIIYRTPRLDIIDMIGNSDYLVQLSDTEGYCFSVVEALSIGTPVIVTDCPVFKELGIKNGVNGFVLPFDMGKVPVDEIYKGLKKFSYEAPKDTWGDILAEGESQYKKDLLTMVTVECIKPYYDLQMLRDVKPGEIYETNKVRAELLEEAKYARLYEERGQ